MMNRDFELFTPFVMKERNSVAQIPKKFFRQERDWTCSIACIRTLLSSFLDVVPSEDFFVIKYRLSPSAYYSKDIKKLDILSEYDVIYGCDEIIDLEKLLDYIDLGYYLMVESSLNCGHWLVFLGYFQVKDKTNLEEHKVLLYDPYYDDVRLMNADEFYSMWLDINYLASNVKRDFIAIKNRE